jgi:hypothetical protein
MPQDNEQQTTTHSTHHEPERKKFAVLVILAAVLILLLWIATLPLNYHSRDGGAAGPQSVLQFLGSQFSTSKDAIGSASETISNAE